MPPSLDRAGTRHEGRTGVREAVDPFAAVCCHGVRTTGGGARGGGTRTTRRLAEWPQLTVLPWEHPGPDRG
jgi:hypothetical protein